MTHQELYNPKKILEFTDPRELVKHIEAQIENLNERLPSLDVFDNKAFGYIKEIAHNWVQMMIVKDRADRLPQWEEGSFDAKQETQEEHDARMLKNHKQTAITHCAIHQTIKIMEDAEKEE